MSTSHEFRNIAETHDADRSDRLFRAAVSAFCALTRPTRRDLVQLEELCLQLYENVSSDTLRYVSAALSECEIAPNALVRRLSSERLEIAAPLLLKSNALREIDLIALIGRHGLGHARVIARRQDLSPTLAALTRKLIAAAERKAPTVAEETRKALREMMRPAASATHDARSPYERLRATALASSVSAFEAELAHTLRIDSAQAHNLLSDSDLDNLQHTLRTLDLTSEQAFLLAAAAVPGKFTQHRAVHSFIKNYEAISSEAASATLGRIQASSSYPEDNRRLTEDSVPLPTHRVA